MSILHVTKGGEKRSYKLNDNKSESLHRYIDLDTGQIYYHMGKQIRGKPIDPNGKLGRDLMEFAVQAFRQPNQVKTKPEPEYSRAAYIILWVIIGLCLLFMLSTC